MADTKIHNLDEGVSEHFEFILGGHNYLFRYPTTEEIQEGRKRLVTKQNPTDKELEEQQKFLCEFIKPKVNGSPGIIEALNKSNIKIQGRFMKMIETEFTGE